MSSKIKIEVEIAMGELLLQIATKHGVVVRTKAMSERDVDLIADAATLESIATEFYEVVDKFRRVEANKR